MRVLIVVHGFPPAAQGGSEIYAHSHARELRDRHGDDVLVLTREADPAGPEYRVRRESRAGLSIVWINNTFGQIRRFEETYRNPAIGAIADRLIDEFRPDVAHVHHLTCLSTTIVDSLARRRIPCFFTLHDYWLMCHRGQLLDRQWRVCDGPGPRGCANCLGPEAGARAAGFAAARATRALGGRLTAAPIRAFRQAMRLTGPWASQSAEVQRQSQRRVEHMRETCDQVTHFYALSRYLLERFVAFGVPSSRISYAEYGVDHTPFSQLVRTPAEHLRLGFLGTMMVSKAPHVLLEAVAGLPADAVSLDMVGGYSPYHGDDAYRATLDAFPAKGNVTFHGPVGHDRAIEALASIDVLVVPSIWPENSPLVIREAFLARIPVVASRIGGIPEMVADGRNGLLFEAGNVDDLRRTLIRLLQEPEFLHRLRGGIPPVRTIADDVAFTRSRYPAVSRPARHIAAVVLNYRTPDETFLAVESLLASRPRLRDIIVVDNDGGKASRDLTAIDPTVVTEVRAGRNLGFSGGMNLGIRAALERGSSHVLLVNSDVIVPPDCVERLARCLEMTPDAGIAGPIVLARSDPRRVVSLGMSYARRTGRMRHLGHGDRVAGLQTMGPTIVDAVSGCLMLVSRDVFDAVGLLDEDFFFSFEDLEFCLRARRAGFSSVLAATTRVHHEGGRSIGARSPQRLYYAARNHLLLGRKTAPAGDRLTAYWSTACIVLLNFAHAIKAPGGPLTTRLRAVSSGISDFLAGRFGAGRQIR